MDTNAQQIINEFLEDLKRPLDPLKYRSMKYTINVTGDTAVDATSDDIVTTDDNPFLWTKASAGEQAEGDQNFLIRIKDTNRYYQDVHQRPDLAFGSPGAGVIIPFDVPIFLDRNSTLTAEIINKVARTGETWVAQVIIHGLERWQR